MVAKPKDATHHLDHADDERDRDKDDSGKREERDATHIGCHHVLLPRSVVAAWYLVMVGFAVMRNAILGLVLLSVGCGSSDGASKPTLEGLWQAQLANGCTGTYDFKGTTFSDNIICLLANGNFGAEIENGTFSANASAIDFVPTASSCRAHAANATDPYSLQGSQLVLTFGSTQVILEKAMVMPVQGGTVVEDGCWDFSQTPGLFTPGPIQNL